MKKLAKVLSVVLCLVMLFAFAACSKAPADEGNDDAGFTTVEKGKLIMATNASFPPYEMYDGDKIVGIDAEVAALIAQKLGLELEIVDIEFDSIIPGVQTGKYDMGMAGMTVNEKRLKNVNFTDSYAKGVQAVIVPANSSITKIDDLAGKKIGVQQGTTGDIYCEDEFGTDAVVKYANGGLAVEALKSGKVDCVVIDNEPAKAYVKANEGLKVLDTSYTDEDYAICISKKNDALKDAVNTALNELIKDGSVKKIVDKYIPAE